MLKNLWAIVYKYHHTIGMEIFGGSTEEEARANFEKSYPNYFICDCVWTGEEMYFDE